MVCATNCTLGVVAVQLHKMPVTKRSCGENKKDTVLFLVYDHPMLECLKLNGLESEDVHCCQVRVNFSSDSCHMQFLIKAPSKSGTTHVLQKAFYMLSVSMSSALAN